MCENIRRIFHYFWNCLNPFLSSRQSIKKQQKTFILCFCSVPLLFHLKNIFPIFSFITVVFVHFFISYFCSSLFASLTFFFSLFYILAFFSLSQCFSFSHLCTSWFLISFSPAPFLCIFFWTNSFFLLSFDLDLFVFILLLHFFFVSSSPSLFFLLKKNSVVNFYRWNCLFLNHPFFGVWSLVFSSLRRPLSLICSMFLLILSVSWHYCSWFSFINLLFGSLRKIVVLFWTKNSKKYHWFFIKNDFLLNKPLFFLILTNFCYKLVFFSFFAIFSMSLKNILCLLS